MTDNSPPKLENAWVLRLGLMVLGLPQIVVGGWALLDSTHWHGGVITPMGPFNDHLVRDVGAALTALGVMLMGATISLRLRTLQLVLIGWLVFALPHAAYHSLHFHQPGFSELINFGGIIIFATIPVLLLVGLSRGGFFRPREETSH